MVLVVVGLMAPRYLKPNRLGNVLAIGEGRTAWVMCAETRERRGNIKDGIGSGEGREGLAWWMCSYDCTVLFTVVHDVSIVSIVCKCCKYCKYCMYGV